MDKVLVVVEGEKSNRDFLETRLRRTHRLPRDSLRHLQQGAVLHAQVARRRRLIDGVPERQAFGRGTADAEIIEGIQVCLEGTGFGNSI